MLDKMVFEPNFSYKSFSIWQRRSNFTIPKIRIPDSGNRISGFKNSGFGMANLNSFSD